MDAATCGRRVACHRPADSAPPAANAARPKWSRPAGDPVAGGQRLGFPPAAEHPHPLASVRVAISECFALRTSPTHPHPAPLADQIPLRGSSLRFPAIFLTPLASGACFSCSAGRSAALYGRKDAARLGPDRYRPVRPWGELGLAPGTDAAGAACGSYASAGRSGVRYEPPLRRLGRRAWEPASFTRSADAPQALNGPGRKSVGADFLGQLGRCPSQKA